MFENPRRGRQARNFTTNVLKSSSEQIFFRKLSLGAPDNFVSNHRKYKTGGGGIYLQNDLQYKLLNECKLSDSETTESIFVEITVPFGKNIIVGYVYRPPNQNTALFLDKFNDILSRISEDNKQF